MKAFDNWGGNIRWSAEEARPDDLDGVRRTIASGAPVTLVASRHSFSGLLRSEGTTLRSDRLPTQVALGPWDAEIGRHRVCVEGQLAVGEAFERMHDLGVALANSGSSIYPSLIGAAATAVHGSDPRWGSISHQDSLRAMHGIDGRGRAFALDAGVPGDADDLLALRAHLGGCGFVGGLQLASVPAYAIETRGALGTLAEALAEAEEAALRATHPLETPDRYEAFWFPHVRGEATPMEGAALRSWRADTEAEPTLGGAISGFLRDLLQGNVAIESLLAAGKLARLAGDDGDVVRLGWRALLRTTDDEPDEEGLVEHWHRGLTGPRHFSGVSMEYALQPGHLASALTELHAVVARWHNNGWYSLGLPINLRWTAQDRGVCMSPAHRGPTAWVDITVSEYGDREEQGPFLAACERVLVDHGGLPHLGKAHWISPRSRWEGSLWEHFWAVRDRYDPDERFLNAHLAALRAGRDLDPGMARERR